MSAVNLINLENVVKAYGPQPLLDGVSLGVETGMRIGIVGRNGGGKSTLMAVMARLLEPDSGRVTHTGGLRLAHLLQRDEFAPDATVRSVVLGDRAEHEWAGDIRARDILSGLLGGLGLDEPLAGMSGGERRRVALAALLVPESDVIMLDEPTNHLDIEAITWLAGHLKARKESLVVVTHDRWFLDEVTDRTWEVVDGRVERYEGGYSAYVLAKAERSRIADAAEAKRQNLMRKELAWLRRGPQARTSKPKFRVDAAQALIADVPPLRDKVELTRFATARLGKTVYDVEDVSLSLGDDPVFQHVTWRLGPGDRVGLVGVNGSGKTTLLRMLAGTVRPDGGRIVRGRTVSLAHLSQEIAELDPQRRVLESVEEIARRITVGKREWTASQLLERLGFRADAQWKPVGDLSGGERRRLQLLRLLMGEPNVMLLDEPTNDLDIETLTELEDILDGWPGTLVVVSHDSARIGKKRSDSWKRRNGLCSTASVKSVSQSASTNSVIASAPRRSGSGRPARDRDRPDRDRHGASGRYPSPHPRNPPRSAPASGPPASGAAWVGAAAAGPSRGTTTRPSGRPRAAAASTGRAGAASPRRRASAGSVPPASGP